MFSSLCQAESTLSGGIYFAIEVIAPGFSPSRHNLFNTQPFPVMGKANDRFHVGMGVKGEDSLRREAAMLGLPWPVVGEVSIPIASAG